MRAKHIITAVFIAACAAFSHGLTDRYHPERASETARTGFVPDTRERTAAYWMEEAGAEARLRAERFSETERAAGPAKSLVIFLGDGMSVPTLTAARTLRGQREGRPGEETRLDFETFPTIGLAKTYCVDAQIPDSACTATAYLCGVKSNQGTLGVTAAVPRWDCAASTDMDTHVASIAAWALEDGRDVGIVTTTRVTHASPAGAFATSANRHWENDAEVNASGFSTDLCPDIAKQLVHHFPGKQFKVILGGGRREFLPTTQLDESEMPGLRTDGRDLIAEWAEDKARLNATHKYVWTRDQLLEASADPPEYLLGLFNNNHLPYHALRDPVVDPTLAEMTEAAIRSLSRNPRGFFLFVEGGRIDHAHHDNQPALALDETLEMDAAVTTARRLLPESEALLLVTADHAHVMTFNGYTRRGGDILGRSDQLDRMGVPYMTLSYGNGPGWRAHVDGRRVDVTTDSDYMNTEWLTHSDVPLSSETHAGDDVAVFALGPRHELFSGLYEQTHVPHRAALAACLGPYRDEPSCENAAHSLTAPTTFVLLTFFTITKLLFTSR